MEINYIKGREGVLLCMLCAAASSVTECLAQWEACFYDNLNVELDIAIDIVPEEPKA